MRVQHLGGYRQQTQAVGVFSDKWLTFSMRGGVLSHLRPAAACHCTATNGAFVTWGGGRDGEREREELNTQESLQVHNTYSLSKNSTLY